MIRTVAALVLVLATADAEAQTEPRGCGETAVLTAPDALIFDGGGVVAAVGTELPRWHLQDGGGVGFGPIAPGLVLFGPIRQTGWTMVRDDTNAPVVRVQFAIADQRAIGLPPPAITAIALAGDGVQVRLASPPPTGTLALVLYGLHKRGQVAQSWARVDPKTPSSVIAVYPAATCPGAIDAKAGDRVAAAWIDAAGRTSVLSAPATVTAGR